MALDDSQKLEFLWRKVMFGFATTDTENKDVSNETITSPLALYGHEIWTAQGDLHEVAKALEAVLGDPEGTKLAWRPQTSIDLTESDAATLIKLIDALDEDDDVQTVWGNYEVSDDVMERLG